MSLSLFLRVLLQYDNFIFKVRLGSFFFFLLVPFFLWLNYVRIFFRLFQRHLIFLSHFPVHVIYFYSCKGFAGIFSVFFFLTPSQPYSFKNKTVYPLLYAVKTIVVGFFVSLSILLCYVSGDPISNKLLKISTSPLGFVRKILCLSLCFYKV